MHPHGGYKYAWPESRHRLTRSGARRDWLAVADAEGGHPLIPRRFDVMSDVGARGCLPDDPNGLDKCELDECGHCWGYGTRTRRPPKKDTKRWCLGRVGREHEWHWTEDPWMRMFSSFHRGSTEVFSAEVCRRCRKQSGKRAHPGYWFTRVGQTPFGPGF